MLGEKVKQLENYNHQKNQYQRSVLLGVALFPRAQGPYTFPFI
jgi:hypothetical protein